MELLEPVTAMLAVYLTPSRGGQPVFLTTPMMDILLHSPVLAQHTNRCSVAELRNSVQKEALKVVMLPPTLVLHTRVHVYMVGYEQRLWSPSSVELFKLFIDSTHRSIGCVSVRETWLNQAYD